MLYILMYYILGVSLGLCTLRCVIFRYVTGSLTTRLVQPRYEMKEVNTKCGERENHTEDPNCKDSEMT